MPVLFDLTFFITLFTLVTGFVYAIDKLWLSSRRPAGEKVSALVEVSRSMFPVILLVLVVRSFWFEPFRIPSDSMMPTLVDGDYIFVSKFAYGLRLPVLDTQLVPIGAPQRGDVVVFHEPKTPSVVLIKRLVGMPGDVLDIRGDAISVNGQDVLTSDEGIFKGDQCYQNFHEGTEQLGSHLHGILYCAAPPQAFRGCNGNRIGLVCEGSAQSARPADDRSVAPQGRYTVPAGEYFFMGDNRDNSADSRFKDSLGFVPRKYLVGKAVRIGFSRGEYRGSFWTRIGAAIP